MPHNRSPNSRNAKGRLAADGRSSRGSKLIESASNQHRASFGLVAPCQQTSVTYQALPQIKCGVSVRESLLFQRASISALVTMVSENMTAFIGYLSVETALRRYNKNVLTRCLFKYLKEQFKHEKDIISTSCTTIANITILLRTRSVRCQTFGHETG